MKKGYKFQKCDNCNKKGLGIFKFYADILSFMVSDYSDYRRSCQYCGKVENYYE